MKDITDTTFQDYGQLPQSSYFALKQAISLWRSLLSVLSSEGSPGSDLRVFSWRYQWLNLGPSGKADAVPLIHGQSPITVDCIQLIVFVLITICLAPRPPALQSQAELHNTWDCTARGDQCSVSCFFSAPVPNPLPPLLVQRHIRSISYIQSCLTGF